MALRILLIDDSPLDRELMRHALHRLAAPVGPAELVCAADWKEAWPHLVVECFDLLLLDVNLPGPSGLDILEELKLRPHPPVIMITGQDDLGTAVETLRAGAYDYVVKSADWGADLRLTIERVRTRVVLERELAASRLQLAAHAAQLEEKVAARTALVEAQAAEIEKLYLKTEEAARVKAEIVGNVSHELRTPLNSILGYAEILADKLPHDRATEAHELLGRIRTQAERLRAVVGSVLALGKLSSMSTAVSISRFTLDALLEEMRSDAVVMNADKGLDLEWRAPERRVSVESDREKVRAIAYHLLSNAIKFTPAGKVIVELERTRQGGILVRVSDTGIGVPHEARAMIFDDFRQLDGSSTRRYDGLGLGLGIVKRSTALLRGTLQLQSTPGKGTTVTVELPPQTRKRSRQTRDADPAGMA